MNYEVVEMTPAKAKELLLRNPVGNRILRSPQLNKIANEIKSGQWKFTGDPIKISKSGILLDGQHRLSGVIAAGIPAKMAIIWGIDDEVFSVLDTVHLNRGPADFLKLNNIKNPSLTAAVVKRLLVWEKTQDKSQFNMSSNISRFIVPREITEYGTVNDAEIQSTISMVARTAIVKNCGAGSAFIAAIIIVNRVDPVATNGFTRDVIDGVMLQKNSPAMLLRNKMMEPPMRGRASIWNTELMAVTIKAWNYHVIGKEVSRLLWVHGRDKFPQPVDLDESMSMAY